VAILTFKRSLPSMFPEMVSQITWLLEYRPTLLEQTFKIKLNSLGVRVTNLNSLMQVLGNSIKSLGLARANRNNLAIFHEILLQLIEILFIGILLQTIHLGDCRRWLLHFLKSPLANSASEAIFPFMNFKYFVDFF